MRAKPRSFYQLGIEIESENSNCFSKKIISEEEIKGQLYFFDKQLLNLFKQDALGAYTCASSWIKCESF